MGIDWGKVGRSGKTLHPIRKAILEYIDKHGQGSPNAISEATNIPLGSVSYHVKVMKEYKEPWLVLAGTAQRRGALEHFYIPGPGCPLIEDEAEEV